ncbi:Streptothricin acetyltransferase A [Paenibacillus auburnensis]|uniref:Streptothricin acetyltransferase A n=1 Tax=Paenibacillus auburnensis TaxID=2905649 RepID=A0ABN8FZI7_9BACL|nr:GNAT family N-acetyltransferase [Paenibacillus auburnensis]CAH1193030.1 Streptothricin acetyltransferase A [Paenibacillus auburnensis]
MDIQIRKLSHLEQARSIEMDSSFIIDSMLNLTINGGQIEYKVIELASYRKSYEELSAGDFKEYIGNPNKTCYLAYAGEVIVGQILLKKHWNKYGYVDYLKVDNEYRGFGIGRQLIGRARLWAEAGGMPGLMLETQNNNVRACKFYESCGFVIGGFDYLLYKGLHPHANEAAIYWYLMFE